MARDVSLPALAFEVARQIPSGTPVGSISIVGFAQTLMAIRRLPTAEVSR